MFNEQDILNVLKDRGIVATGRIAEDIFQTARFFIFVEIERNSENLQVPSNKTLNEAKDHFAAQGVLIEFVLTDARTQDIEAGYRASMLHSFGNVLRNGFLTINGSNTTAWIVPKAHIEADVLAEIEEKSRLFLANYDLHLSALEYTSSAKLPGKFLCLQVVRALAPAKISILAGELQRREFTIPSENWLSRMLDSLRKGGFVIRLKSEEYVLTLAGLKALGTMKNRRSPDITRTLALARRGE